MNKPAVILAGSLLLMISAAAVSVEAEGSSRTLFFPVEWRHGRVSAPPRYCSEPVRYEGRILNEFGVAGGPVFAENEEVRKRLNRFAVEKRRVIVFGRPCMVPVYVLIKANPKVEWIKRCSRFAFVFFEVERVEPAASLPARHACEILAPKNLKWDRSLNLLIRLRNVYGRKLEAIRVWTVPDSYTFDVSWHYGPRARVSTSLAPNREEYVCFGLLPRKSAHYKGPPKKPSVDVHMEGYMERDGKFFTLCISRRVTYDLDGKLTGGATPLPNDWEIFRRISCAHFVAACYRDIAALEKEHKELSGFTNRKVFSSWVVSPAFDPGPGVILDVSFTTGEKPRFYRKGAREIPRFFSLRVMEIQRNVPAHQRAWPLKTWNVPRLGVKIELELHTAVAEAIARAVERNLPSIHDPAAAAENAPVYWGPKGLAAQAGKRAVVVGEFKWEPRAKTGFDAHLDGVLLPNFAPKTLRRQAGRALNGRTVAVTGTVGVVREGAAAAAGGGRIYIDPVESVRVLRIPTYPVEMPRDRWGTNLPRFLLRNAPEKWDFHSDDIIFFAEEYLKYRGFFDLRIRASKVFSKNGWGSRMRRRGFDHVPLNVHAAFRCAADDGTPIGVFSFPFGGTSSWNLLFYKEKGKAAVSKVEIYFNTFYE